LLFLLALTLLLLFLFAFSQLVDLRPVLFNWMGSPAGNFWRHSSRQGLFLFDLQTAFVGLQVSAPNVTLDQMHQKSNVSLHRSQLTACSTVF
jgi:hypothetical protein